METRELIESNTPTKSFLSDWIGAPTDTSQTTNSAARLGENKAVPDTNQIGDRIFSLIEPNGNSVDTLPMGPASPNLYLFSVEYLFTSLPLKRLLRTYYGVAWDAIEITISPSNPIGIVGAFVAGYYPWVPWFQTDDLTVELGRHNLNAMTRQRLMLSPEAQMCSFSERKDVKFTIPWTYPTPHLMCEPLAQIASISHIGSTGVPIVYLHTLVADWINTVTAPAQMRVYAKFVNLRWLGPYVTPEPSSARTGAKIFAQSGAVVAASALAGVVVDKVVDTGAEILSDAVGALTHDGFDDDEITESYTHPISVQQAYIGDTTSVGPPPSTPIFNHYLKTMERHSFLEYLQRPQYIGRQFVDGVSRVYYANPTFPNGYSQGQNQLCTYFRWFANVFQYWRGTINLHFVILGHPLVSVESELSIGYPYAVVAQPAMGSYSVNKALSAGTSHIKVPMPNLNYRDHHPIVDSLVTDQNDNTMSFSASTLNAKFQIVSTMLDRAPAIYVAVFMSAEPDFEYMQPYAVGLNHAVDAELLKRRAAKMTAQVGLLPPAVHFETRANTLPTTHSMPSSNHIEDVMSIWSRSLPYEAYDDNDEPIVTLDCAAQPVSWPYQGGSAAWTLDVNNSWFVTQDYISYLSSQFLYYRGAVALKILCKEGENAIYKFVTLAPNRLGERQPTNNPYTYPDGTVPFLANFGNGTVITPNDKQPVIDVTVPFRSTLAWNPVNWDFVHWSFYEPSLMSVDLRNGLLHNVVLQESEGDLIDALYRKIGSDYSVCVEGLLPPAPLWLAKGFDWES